MSDNTGIEWAARRKLDAAGFIARREYRQEGLGAATRAALARARLVRLIAARHAVSYAIRVGKLPNPNILPCQDCGHVDTDRRHEYDHHLGYDPAHHLHVEAVCTTCHADRERARRG